jgi:pimeloyl-ACP methyl ester carboxylesterase
MPSVEILGLDLFYQEAGRIDAEPVVLLHGFTVTGGMTWGPHMDAFAAKYRVIVPDLRGHGRTGNPDGPAAMNLHQFATDIGGMCSALGISRAAFCGYSAGAMLQLWLALEEPSLLAASIFISGSYRIPASVRAAMQAVSADQLAEEWFGLPLNRTPNQVPPTAAHHVALGPDHWYRILVDFLALFQRPQEVDFPHPSALSEILAPTLLIHGDADFFFPVEDAVELSRRLANAELHVLVDCPHEVVDQHPEVVTSLCLPFLERWYLTTPISS